MTEPARHLRPVESPIEGLRVIDPNGVIVAEFETILQEREDVIAGLQRDVRAEHLRYENLKRDKAAEAREHGLFPKVKELFDYWRKTTNHPRAQFMPDRFWTAVPFLEKFGEAAVRLAIEGAGYDPFETVRKNGSRKRHDGWHLIFNADKFEDFANRAPRKGTDERPGTIEGSAASGEPDSLRTPGPQGQSQIGLPGIAGA